MAFNICPCATRRADSSGPVCLVPVAPTGDQVRVTLVTG